MTESGSLRVLADGSAICTTCRQPCIPVPSLKHKTLCRDCHEKRKKRVREGVAALYGRRRAAGLCEDCDTPTGDDRYCPDHRRRSNERTLKHYRNHRANPLAVVRKLCRAAKMRCRSSGREFAIIAEDLTPIPSMCPVLGILIEYAYRPESKGPRNNSPSLDRIDNTLGYVKGNVRIVSYRANRLRSDATEDELRALLRDMELSVPKK